MSESLIMTVGTFVVLILPWALAMWAWWYGSYHRANALKWKTRAERAEALATAALLKASGVDVAALGKSMKRVGVSMEQARAALMGFAEKAEGEQ